MNKDEALKLACEALEDPAILNGVNNAKFLIKKALAQPEQEPVAWMYDWLCDGKLITGWIAHSESEIPKATASNIRPLYTTPPKREWVELTDDEFHDLQIENIDDPWANFKAIEAKLKEKNT